jgi:hypothetical protein
VPGSLGDLQAICHPGCSGELSFQWGHHYSGLGGCWVYSSEGEREAVGGSVND